MRIDRRTERSQPIRLTHKKAFTLVELLVVVAIIGILFAVLISRINFATDKSRVVGVETDFRSYQMAFKAVATENAGFSILVDSTLSNPYSELERQINKNLDPELQITISNDGSISTNAQDPWSSLYTGAYIPPDADGTIKDRGAIAIFCSGQDAKSGLSAEIQDGDILFGYVEGKSYEAADDYGTIVIYSFASGYGASKIESFGFDESNSLVGELDNSIGENENIDNDNLPNPKGDLSDYSWTEIQKLAKVGLTADEYSSTYGIDLGDTISDGTNTYYLVDLDGNNYGGFVFMYQSGQSISMNSSNTNTGGYASSELAPKVEALYSGLSADLQAVIKEVTIKCNDGNTNYTTMHDYLCHLFLASHIEIGGIGFSNSVTNYASYNSALNSEGSLFDYFEKANNATAANALRVAVGGSSFWLVRSAYGTSKYDFWYVTASGRAYDYIGASTSGMVVPAFVIG